MIAVAVTHENQIRLGKIRVSRRAVRRIVVNHLPVPAHHERGVADGVDDRIPVRGGEVVARQVVRARQFRRAIKTRVEIRRGGVGVLVHPAAAQGQQRIPAQEIGVGEKIRSHVEAIISPGGRGEFERHFTIGQAL